MQERSATERIGTTGRDITAIESFHKIKFDDVFQKLFLRFPCQKIEVLDEACGYTNLKKDLRLKKYPKRLTVISSDIKKWGNTVDVVSNILGLEKKFGKNRFHLVVSTYGGASYSPLPEKALFQIVEILRPGGIGIISADIPRERLDSLAKRFNISYQSKERLETLIFTKNFARGKRT
jgi:SAM-dependent methyltransferase